LEKLGTAGIPSSWLGKAGNLDFFKLRFWNSWDFTKTGQNSLSWDFNKKLGKARICHILLRSHAAIL
jgi:hypothetical protein